MGDIINEELKNLQNEMKGVKESLILLTEAIEKLSETCSRMNTHINFVEGTYSSLRSPLDFFKRKVEYLMGRTEYKELPQIE